MKKFFLLICIMAMLIITQAGCDSQAPNSNQGVGKSSFHLDTLCTVTIYSMDGAENLSEDEQEKEALLLITDAFKMCDDYEKILSRTVEDSDIYKINHAGGQWVEVQDCTIDVIKKGIKYADISGGLFDITIGDVSQLWDFHEQDEEGEKTGTLPDKAQLQEAVRHVDYKNIQIDGNRVRLADSQATIDLGGIAKGYIADRVADYLEENGVTGAIVDLGGNIVAIGKKGSSMEDSEGTDFSVGVASPVSGRGEILGAISCSDKTIVTSGTYERYFEIDGVRYHHVLDPDTGYPFDTDLLSVTIIGDKGTSADCDGLSTTCLAMGKEAAYQLLEQTEGVGAILVDMDGKITTVNADDIWTAY